MNFSESFNELLKKSNYKYLFDDENNAFVLNIILKPRLEENLKDEGKKEYLWNEQKNCFLATVFIFPMEKLQSLRFFIPRISKINKAKRNAIKTFVLDFNMTTLYGNFAIQKRSEFISYQHGIFLEHGCNLSEKELNEYMKYISYVCSLFIEKTIELNAQGNKDE